MDSSFSFLTGSILLIGLLICIFYWCHTKNFNYWKDQNIPFLKPLHWFYGSLKDPFLLKCTWSEFLMMSYNELKHHGFGGLFIMRRPAVFICDPALVEKILVQNFGCFCDRASKDFSGKLSDSLLTVSGERWKTLRIKLTPTFSAMKIKGMFNQIIKSSDHLMSNIVNKLMESNGSVDIEPLIFEYCTEAMVSCTFGIHLPRSRNQLLKDIITNMYKLSSRLRSVEMTFCWIYPKLAALLGLRSIANEVASFFFKLTRSAIKYRRANGVERNDFLHLLLSLQEGDKHYKRDSFNVSSKKETFTDDCIASTMFNFFTSGVNPTITTISFALYEISRSSIIQHKLQKEIFYCIERHDGMTYDAISDMTYLDQVIQETLRMYSFNPAILRTVTGSFKIPGTDVVLQTGMSVYIPINGIHMDAQYYPIPEKFEPERFDGNNYKASPTFLPFGLGPRMCLAIRFAVTTMKVCIARLLVEYEIKPKDNMGHPLRFDKNYSFPKTEHGIWLCFKKRT